MRIIKSNDLKHSLRKQGFTLKSFAAANQFNYRAVSDVFRGVRRGNYGEGRDIYLKLGLDPEAEQIAA
jgi:gp16 family phage-associated protein